MDKQLISCPGSCGELFQCVVGEEECLLSYNIDRRVKLTCQDGGDEVSVSLGSKMEKCRDFLGISTEVKVIAYQGELPIGKGYSSSTADIVSYLYALTSSQGFSYSPRELTQLAVEIEASDSVAFENWTVINPLTGKILHQTAWKPELYVYILEPETYLSTEDIDRMVVSPAYPYQESSKLFDLYQTACREKSLQKLGLLATKSARLNNQRLPKPYLEEIIQLAIDYGSIGVNVAHSGTIVGILFTKEALSQVEELELALSSSDISNYYQTRSLHRIIYEGVRRIKEEYSG